MRRCPPVTPPDAPGRAAPIPGVEGVRAVAAVSVLIFHCWRYTADGPSRADLGLVDRFVLPHLSLGVTLFFSLSGFEPSGNSAPTDIIIQSNIMVHDTPAIAVSISGISGPDPTRRVNFSDNILLGGQLFSTDVDQLTIQDNMVLVPAGARAGNRIPLHIQRGGDSVLITGNLLVDENAETEALLVVSEVNQRPVDRAIIANNLCFARSGTGIRVSSSEDVAVEGNLVVATGPCAVGIVLQSTPTSLDRVAARGNDITVEGPGSWDTGILLNARAESPAHHVRSWTTPSTAQSKVSGSTAPASSRRRCVP
jgi:hypothetical protein